MALRRTLSALLVGTLVACGGTYAGLGEDLDETGGPLGDDSGGIDAIFPIDDGATPDVQVDSTLVDSGTLDAQDAADSTLVDAVDATDARGDAFDSTLVDAVDAADTAVADTVVADTAVADTAVADTAVDDATDAADSTVVDTGTPDTGPLDTGTPDTGTPDTGPLDTGTPDTGVVDMGSDAGLFSTNPNQVYCGNTAGLLCAKNQLCCGSYSFGSGWSYACTTSCNAFGQRSFECNEKADCSSGQVCCANRAPFGSSNLADSSCHSSCGGIGNPPVQLCMTAADCPTGHACVPGTTDGASSQTIGQCN
jgi:hypothetical protein